MLIVKQDTDGSKPLLEVGELGYDNYPAGGDIGRVHVGTGSSNVMLAKKIEVDAVDGKADAHIARVDNPHVVTKAQVGLGNVDNTADIDKPISTAAQAALDLKADINSPTLIGVPSAPTAAVGDNTTQIATTAFVNSEIANDTYSKTQLDVGQLDNRYYTEAETNLLLGTKVDDTDIESVNLLRADKYLAAQNIVNMLYTDGDLTKIRYKNNTDVDYETLSYTSGNLTSINHYVGSILKGTTTLSYAGGNLVSAIFVGI